MDKNYAYGCRIFTLLSFLLLIPLQGNAKEHIDKFDFSLSAGSRIDELNWNHAGPGRNPNTLSELKWEDLEIYQVSNSMRLNWYESSLPVGFALRSRVDYGSIYGGTNQDSDYMGDNRSGEFSRSNNKSDDGSVWDLSVSAGLTLFKNSKMFHLTPLLGYSYHEQNLTMTDGYQTIDTVTGQIGTFEDTGRGVLNSTYDSTWKGGFVGLEMVLELNKRFSFNSTIEYHDADYSSEADWNLRSSLKHPVSFTNIADDGSGMIYRGGILFALNDTYLFTFDFNYKDWQAEGGKHTKYYSDGSTFALDFNEVNWNSYSANIGVTIRYH